MRGVNRDKVFLLLHVGLRGGGAPFCFFLNSGKGFDSFVKIEEERAGFGTLTMAETDAADLHCAEVDV